MEHFEKKKNIRNNIHVINNDSLKHLNDFIFSCSRMIEITIGTGNKFLNGNVKRELDWNKITDIIFINLFWKL